MDRKNLLTHREECGDDDSNILHNGNLAAFLDVLFAHYIDATRDCIPVKEIKDLDPGKQILFDFRPSFCCCDNAIVRTIQCGIVPLEAEEPIAQIKNIIAHNMSPTEYYLGLYIHRVLMQDHWCFRLVGVMPDGA
jgi:hypothetical protein